MRVNIWLFFYKKVEDCEAPSILLLSQIYVMKLDRPMHINSVLFAHHKMKSKSIESISKFSVVDSSYFPVSFSAFSDFVHDAQNLRVQSGSRLS